MSFFLGTFQAWYSAGIQIDGCLLTYAGRDLCTEACKFDFHGARYKQPFSESFPKLEVSEATRFNPRGQLVVGSEVGETSEGPQGVLQVSTKTSTLPQCFSISQPNVFSAHLL